MELHDLQQLLVRGLVSCDGGVEASGEGDRYFCRVVDCREAPQGCLAGLVVAVEEREGYQVLRKVPCMPVQGCRGLGGDSLVYLLELQ